MIWIDLGVGVIKIHDILRVLVNFFSYLLNFFLATKELSLFGLLSHWLTDFAGEL